LSRNKQKKKRAHAGAGATLPNQAAISSDRRAKDASVPADTADAAEPASSDDTAILSLEQMESVVRQLVSVQAWDDLIAYSQTPLDQVASAERQAAAVYLARVRVCAIRLKVPQGQHLADSTAPGLQEALADLRKLDPALWRHPEFDIYLDALSYSSLPAIIDAFWLLMSACAEKVDAKWLQQLHDKVLRLVDPDDEAESITADVRAQLEQLPPVTGLYDIIFKALTRALHDPSLKDHDRLLVQVLDADIYSRMCEPWDYPKAVERILALPRATPKQVGAIPEDEYPGRPGNRLTPEAWAFLWELGTANAGAFEDLIARQPAAFGLEAADGLLKLVKSVLAENERERDSYLVEATDLLMKAQDYWDFFRGENIVVAMEPGCTVVWAGHLGLNFDSTFDLVLRIYENVADDYVRANELHVLLEVLKGLEATSETCFEDKLVIPGLDWMCERNMAFQMQAACYVPNKALSWSLFLGGLVRHTEEQVAPPYRYFSQDSDGNLKNPKEAMLVLDALGEVVQVRSRMQDYVERAWLDSAKDVFQDLLEVEDNDVRQRTLDVARDLEDDLIMVKGGAFALGYLEQVAGEREAALPHYVQHLQEADEVESAVKNLQILLSNFDRSAQLESALEEFGAMEALKHPKEVAGLIAHTKARLKAVLEQKQFERTAVNRWPTVSAQARQVLSALELIKSFTGFDELGRYAGMDSTWAGRHYKKLVTLGLVIETENGRKFHINPHIKPLLAQENKHSVVGRIVRSSGTSAVKPLFNSQREFTIYQVMTQLCPNHLVFPNCALQSIVSFDRIKDLVSEDEFSYYLKASVDIVLVSTTTYLPMLAIEVDSVWHDTEKQQKNDKKKDSLFAAAGIPFMRLRPVGSPSQATIRGQVAEHLDELVRTLRSDLPGFDQAKQLIEDLSGTQL
jgi:hypothetical protein